MSNPCKNCACCMTTSKDGEVRFWCSQGAFDFGYTPEDSELDWEYLQSICSSYESMDEETIYENRK